MMMRSESPRALRPIRSKSDGGISYEFGEPFDWTRRESNNGKKTGPWTNEQRSPESNPAIAIFAIVACHAGGFFARVRLVYSASSERWRPSRSLHSLKAAIQQERRRRLPRQPRGV